MTETEDPKAIIADLAEIKQARMSDDLRRALTLLSEQLYARDVHFVMELVQNAEDNTYEPSITDRFIEFTVDQDVIEVHNNEIGFTGRNVEALCAVGDSTKRERTLGYVGEKGIGFKSVFQVSAEPAIFSSGFCFAFDDHDKIVPHWCDPPQHVNPFDGTTIVLKLRPDYQREGRRPIGAQVAEIDPLLMLFLKTLTRIAVSDRTAERRVEFRRVNADDDCVRIEGGSAQSTWRLFPRAIEVPDRIQEEKRKGVRQRELVVAFRTDAAGRCVPDRESLVFAFLPTDQRSGLSFLLQGDFLLTADRGALLEDSLWNLWLRDEVGPTIVQAVRNGVSRHAFALSIFNCLPLPQDVRNPFFRTIAEHVIEHLPREAVFMTISGKLRAADEVLRASTAVRALFPNDQLAELLGCEIEYLHPECDSSSSHSVLDALGVRRFDGEALLTILSNTDWLEGQNEDWFTNLYVFLYHNEHLASAEKLRAMLIVLLENKELARPLDGTIYLPVREERLEERYGLAQFKWRLVAHAVVRRDPSPTTDEARAHNDRTQKAREFLVERLQVQYHRPLEIAVEQIFPYFGKRLAKLYTKEDLRKDFGLVLYLKEQWPEICEWSERPNAAVGPSDLVEQAKRSIPVPLGGTRQDGVRAVGQTYMPAGFGGSMALEQLLSGVPDVEFLSTEFIAWDQQRARDERKTEEWRKFLSAAGAHQHLRLVPCRTVGRQAESPSEHLPEGARVTRAEGEIEAPEIGALIEKIARSSPEAQRERGQQLLRHLDDCWEEWERQHGGTDWYLAKYHYKPFGKGNHQEQNASVPVRFIRELRRATWVPTQDGRCLRPEEVWVDSGRVRESAARIEALLQGRISSPGLVRALGLRTDITADAIIADLRRLVAEMRLDLGQFRSRYQQLAKLQCDGNLTDRDREILNRERLIYVPDRTPPFANALEVVWQEPRELFARGFPALERHYVGLGEFFATIGVAKCMTPRQALRAITGISDDVYSDKACQRRLWEAYQVLAGADLAAEAADDGDWPAELSQFRREGRLFCRYNRFRTVDRVFAPDDERVVALFGRQIEFLWVPDGAPISIITRLAEVLQLPRASAAAKTVEAVIANAPPEFNDQFNACRRPLIGYVRQEHQVRYQTLFKEGKLGEFAAAPLVPASSLTVRYALGEFEVADSRNVHAVISACGVYVLVAEVINHDEIAAAIQRDLGNVPAVAEVFTVLFPRSARDREVYARKRHYEVPPEDWQRILDNYQPPSADTSESPPPAGAPSARKPDMAASADSQPPPSPILPEDTSPPDKFTTPLERPDSTGAESPQAFSPQRGIPFQGRTQLVSPRGNNQRLKEQLGSTFPARRSEIDGYFQDAAPAASLIEAWPDDEDGVVRKAKTILRAVNLEEAFLQFHSSAMMMFRAAKMPDEIFLTGDDDEGLVLVKIDYERAILHAGVSGDDKLRLRAFLEREALLPGAILELQATHQVDEYHLRAIRPDEPQIITDVSYWDFNDDGSPETKSIGSVRLEFLVDDATYRAERRWEQRDAYNALISGNPGILADVYSWLEERANSGAAGVMATEVHRHLLSHDHPCGYSSVLGVLYGYECFTHDDNGRWHLAPNAEQTRRPGYEKNIAVEKAPPSTRSKTGEGTGKEVPLEGSGDSATNRGSTPVPAPAANDAGHSSALEKHDSRGALSVSHAADVERALRILGASDKNAWLDAARTIATVFAQLIDALESNQRTTGKAKATAATSGERISELLALARKNEKIEQLGLASALLSWQIAHGCSDRRQGDALRLVGLAMQQLGAPRWALRCFEEASKHFGVLVPRLAPLREAARQTGGDQRSKIIAAAQAGARALIAVPDLLAPELEKDDWPAAVVATLPKVD